MLKACLNGPRSQLEHPRLPTSAEQIGLDAHRVQRLGVDAVHIHVKDAAGVDTFEAALTDSAVSAVRHAAPGLPVGVTTGAWILPDASERAVAIQSWAELPDFASVNWHEDGADLVAATLLDRGIAVEGGLWNADGAAAWLASPVRDACFRVLIELPDGLDARQSIDEADRLIDMVGDALVVLHGEGTSCWPALQHAGRLGFATRIGLEDTLTMPDGSFAADNVALVQAAQHLLGGP